MKSKKILIGGINQDDAEFLMDAKEYLAALNARFVTSENGQVGKISTVEGTREVYTTIDSYGNNINFELPAGVNEAIGAATDESNNQVLWMVWNSNGNHAIYCYDMDDDLVYTVLKNADVVGGLGFSRNRFIDSTVVIDGLIYWTANIPKRFNIESGIKLNHPTYVTSAPVYTAPLTAEMLLLARAQPALPPTVSFISATGYPTLIDGCKATYRFVYKDGETSAFSTLSRKNPVPVGSGYLRITIPSTQPITQDVERIELAIRYPDGNYFIVKSWTSFGGTLQYDFDSSAVGAAVDSAIAVKPYDAVPLTAEQMELAKYRLILGNILGGYDSPSSPPIPTIIGGQTTIGGSDPQVALKTGSTYKVGMVWYDSVGRYCGVVPIGSATIPNRRYNMGGAALYSRIEWTLTNSTTYIPTWAKYYSIVCTKNKKTDFFFQGVADEIKFAVKDTSGAFVFSAPPTVPANLYGIAFKLSGLYKSGYGYSYNPGDIFQAYVLNPSTGATVDVSVSIIEQYADYVIVEYHPTLAGSTAANCVFEIYTPSAKLADDVYFEMGNKYEVLNSGTSLRSLSVTSGVIEGDVAYKNRSVGGGTYYLEVMNLEDKYWKEWYTDHGRPMTEVTIKNKVAPLDMRWSNIKGSVINGLSSFDALDITTMPSELVSIRKMIMSSKAEAEGTVLLVIGERETASVYIGESQIIDNKGSSFLASSSGVIGNINTLRGGYGTLHPESVYRWSNHVVFFDTNKGCVVRYDSNGLQAISDAKMRRYFKKVGQDILQYRKDPTRYNNTNNGFPLRVLGMVDPFNEEYLINLPMMGVIPANEILEDMELGRQTYTIQTAAACGFSIVVEEGFGDCSFIVIAE